MVAEFFNNLLEWIRLNPHWSYFAIFLVSAGESLTLVGLFLPGVAIMFGVGALVAAEALELWPTLIAAAAGAVLGDGLSFWLGRHFHQQLRVIWPFNRYPELVNRGVDFFHRHGGMSVVLARFLGPVRPILPTVAGMLDMPPRKFLAFNIFSALVWAPAYILPGVAFGASLALASQVAGRLALLVLILVASGWFLVWLVRLAVRLLQPRASFLMARALDWGRSHPLIELVFGALLDPERPEARGLAILALMLVLGSLLVAWLFSGWLSGLDLLLHEALAELRNPFMDQVMIFVTGLGDTDLLLSVLAAGLGWLFVMRRPVAALHWMGLVALVAGLGYGLKYLTQMPRPVPIYEGLSAFSFPSSHTSLGIALYGFLAVLIARELTPRWRILPYASVTLLVAAIAFSRLYLGVHWLSDILGGVAIGFLSLALFGIAYRTHSGRPLGLKGILLVIFGTLIIMGFWRDDAAQQALYLKDVRTQSQSLEVWQAQGWQLLPAKRQDLKASARQALNIQYAGELDSLVTALEQAGWQRPTRLSLTSALQWLVPEPELAVLPVLPQIHGGQQDSLRLVRFNDDGRMELLRLWPTHWRLQPGQRPLWIGSLTDLRLEHRLKLLSILRQHKPASSALDSLAKELFGIEVGQKQRPGSGPLLLLQSSRK